MGRIAAILMLALVLACGVQAAEIQGVVADWNCTQRMVQNGREKTLRRDGGCSLMKNYTRSSYGLITDDKKFYRLDDPDNRRILQLLRNTPDKDNLKVVVTGDLQGNTIKVTRITML